MVVMLGYSVYNSVKKQILGLDSTKGNLLFFRNHGQRRYLLSISVSAAAGDKRNRLDLYYSINLDSTTTLLIIYLIQK